jgi:amino acid adenylation domain-containing protein
MNADAAKTDFSTRTPEGRALNVVSRFEACAARWPDAVAVTCGETSITYAELDRRANRLARHLHAIGAGPGSVVALCMTRSIELLVGMLGILKAGAAYLPQDLMYPRDRLGFMLEDAEVSAVVTLEGDRDAVPDTDVPVIRLDTDRERIDAMSSERPEITHAPDSLAYVIYTSGSTGKPKGCQITHANLVSYFDAVDRAYDLRQDDVWSFFQSHAFDVSGLEIWGALTHGARLVVVPYLVTRSPEVFRQLLIDERVTCAAQTPTAFGQLMRADDAAGGRSDYALRYVFLGGEAVELQALRPWFERYGDEQPLLVNMYGPTEATIYVTHRVLTMADVERGAGSVIGGPLDNSFLRVLDEQLRPVPVGAEGELFIGGAGVTRGYLKRPELTAERFIHWRDPARPDMEPEFLYRSGDLARELPDGDFEYLGRLDFQVKLRGFRIELGEIEAALTRHPSVHSCVVLAREDRPGDKRLVAYLVPNGEPAPIAVLRAHLSTGLPDYMVPSAFVYMDAMPLTVNGKLDRKALPAPGRERPELSVAYEPAVDALEQRVCAAFVELLGVDGVGRHDNFFELGGDSVLATRLVERLRGMQLGDGRMADAGRVPVTLVFRNPTPAALAATLCDDTDDTVEHSRLPGAYRADGAARADDEDNAIAIVAMSGRFPGADDVEAFWRNLCEGRDSITTFGLDGLDPAVRSYERDHPGYVPARGVIDGVEMFDPAFFGFSPKEAELMDPQQRIALELCWECLERAGHVPDAAEVPVGVFIGMHHGTYFQRHIAPRADLVENVGDFPITLLNESDYLATQVAHKLNLTGPAINVQAACSTSLVAICQAVDSLRAGQCDMALAGGVSIKSPPRSGYVYQEGAMFSPDGHTRTFDRDAKGTVFSDGGAIVLLRRLADARADGDPVFAVIRGVALNNDGRNKGSYTGPSSDGQAAVIAMAHRNAGVDARSIGYVEAHGTATPLGDPIEIEGLTKAFRRSTEDTGFCRIGSVKSNVGHLVVAAGSAGLVKTALSLAEKKIPASLHFEAPNPVIDFASTPFVVSSSLGDWPREGETPRRAGVSSFGVGGTNAHVVLEEAPERPASEPAHGPQLLVLSARTPSALGHACTRLADHLEAHPDANLADVAWTLAAGRKAFPHRVAVVADDVESAIASLRNDEAASAAARSRPARQSDVVFMFPGQGATYPAMGRGLYETDTTFRNVVDECSEHLREVLGFDLRDRLFADDAEALLPTSVMQPATFVIEYALARWWMAHGITPAAMVGHSVGEFVAATLAGVFALPDALRLVARRGALMQAQPEGGMLSVRMACEPLLERLREHEADGLTLAAENAPGLCVVAGPLDALARFESGLGRDGIACRMLRTSHAFHSSMMEPVVEPFHAEVAAITLSPPRLPLVSTATGEWLDAATATSPDYWSRHLREPVRFATALGRLTDVPARVLLEVGPRTTLSTFARQHPAVQKQQIAAVATLADTSDGELRNARAAAGALWCRGVVLDPAVFDGRARRQRVRLPTYPFERKRYWIDAVVATPAARAGDTPEPATSTEPAMPATHLIANASTQPTDRRPALLGQLRALFQDVTGFDFENASPDDPFVELGLDSLMLTQVTQRLQKTFPVELTFRQLMSDASTFAKLAGLLDAQLPPEAPAPAVAPGAAPVAPAVMPAPAPAATLQPAQPGTGGTDWMRGVVAQQLELMRRQLEWLDGANPSVAAAPPKLPPAAATGQAPEPESASRTPDAEPKSGIRYDVRNAFGTIARIHADRVELAPRQQARLDAFIDRYTARTRKSKEHTQDHRSHLADPRVVSGFRPMTKEIAYPLVVSRSKGARMWDLDGNEYVDALSGFGMNLFGWQPDFVLDAVKQQLDLGYEIGPQHPLAGEVARLVCELTSFDRAALCNTGSEAVMGAVRIARTVIGRSTLVVFSGSYHGVFDEAIVRGSESLRGIPAAPGILDSATQNVLVLDYGVPESLEVIRERAHEIAAVLVEPVQSRRPGFLPREFLQELRTITMDAGTALIFDEVITGFRAHPRGVQGVVDVTADLATYGKVVGGGMPIGVIAGKREYMDALDGGHWQFGDESAPTAGVTYFAGTFVRHPLALAAAKAVLEHLKAAGPALQQLLNARTAAMAGELNAFCEDVGAPIRVDHFASLWRVAFTQEHPLQDLLFPMMRSRGIHILDDFPCFLATAHTEADIAAIVEAFRQSVIELQEARFIPRKRQGERIEFDPKRPPRPGARLGRDAQGSPAWFIPNPDAPGKYIKVGA